MLYHDWSCFSKHWSTVSAVLSRRRAVTSVSSCRSCARPRRSQSSDPRGLTPSPAEAAQATTPASPTISMKACFWHTHLLTLPQMCEARSWNYCEKDSTDSLIRNVLQLGNTLRACSHLCVSYFFWHYYDSCKITEGPQCQTQIAIAGQNCAVFPYCKLFLLRRTWIIITTTGVWQPFLTVMHFKSFNTNVFLFFITLLLTEQCDFWASCVLNVHSFPS